MGYTRKGARDIWRRQNRTHLNLLPRLSGRVLKDAAKEYHQRPEVCGYLQRRASHSLYPAPHA